MTECCLVLCTCPDDTVAAALARALVDAEAAACVNRIGGVRSTYRWEGAIEEADEVMLVIKTTPAAVSRVRQLIQDRHPYELPEIVTVPITGGASDYLAWLAGSVR